MLPALFCKTLPHGTCVGVRPPDAITPDLLSALHPAERAHVETLSPSRARLWIAGRLALRLALEAVGTESAPLLVAATGAPLIPAPAIGSISHKRDLVVALATLPRGASTFTIGVDLETYAAIKRDISGRILSPAERGTLPSPSDLDPAPRAREILRRFSAKEAVYKAIHPHLLRSVSFMEVTLQPTSQDSPPGYRATLAPRGDEPAITIEVHVHELGAHVLTTALATPSAATPPAASSGSR